LGAPKPSLSLTRCCTRLWLPRVLVAPSLRDSALGVLITRLMQSNRRFNHDYSVSLVFVPTPSQSYHFTHHVDASSCALVLVPVLSSSLVALCDYRPLIGFLELWDRLCKSLHTGRLFSLSVSPPGLEVTGVPAFCTDAHHMGDAGFSVTLSCMHALRPPCRRLPGHPAGG